MQMRSLTPHWAWVSFLCLKMSGGQAEEGLCGARG